MGTLDLGQLAPDLRRDADGVWRRHGNRVVSYPESGHGECFAIEDESYWFAHRNRVLVDLVGRFPPGGPIFDIGGGNGAVAHALVEAGCDVVLVEPGREGVDNALRRGLPTILEASFEDVGFRRGSLTAVGLFDVLEHIEDDGAFLSGVAEALVDDGRIFLTVPAHAFLWSAADEYAGHFRRYRRGSLRQRLSAAGLEPEWITHFFAPLPLPIWLLRSLPSRWRQDRTIDVTAAQRQHRAAGSNLGAMVTAMLAAERSMLARGWSLPFGSSLVAVARRCRLSG